MSRDIEELRRVERMEGRSGKREMGKKEEIGDVEGKIRKLERWKEREDRERRRRNVVVKWLRAGKKDMQEAVRGLWRKMRVQTEMEEVREINMRKEGRR